MGCTARAAHAFLYRSTDRHITKEMNCYEKIEVVCSQCYSTAYHIPLTDCNRRYPMRKYFQKILTAFLAFTLLFCTAGCNSSEVGDVDFAARYIFGAGVIDREGPQVFVVRSRSQLEAYAKKSTLCTILQK